jgi:hypothetical protein
VATTNNWEALDRAISRRPSRFDRVIRLSLPSLEERRELVSLLCQKIPIDVPTQSYIAGKTDGCTPAQLQEIVHGLAIEYREESSGTPSLLLDISRADIDRAISRFSSGAVRRRRKGRMYFYSVDSSSAILIGFKKMVNLALIEPLVEDLKGGFEPRGPVRQLCAGDRHL